jgi:hypothetical protein
MRPTRWRHRHKFLVNGHLHAGPEYVLRVARRFAAVIIFPRPKKVRNPQPGGAAPQGASMILNIDKKGISL